LAVIQLYKATILNIPVFSDSKKITSGFLLILSDTMIKVNHYK